jgi:hypothetical protein
MSREDKAMISGIRMAPALSWLSLGGLMLLNGIANAAVVDCTTGHYNNRVLITGANPGDGWDSVNPGIPASECLGVYDGNDDVSQLGLNRGIRDVGFLNDIGTEADRGEFYEYGAFLTGDDLLDMDDDGQDDDPGWIFVNKIDLNGNDETRTQGTVKSLDESMSYTFHCAPSMGALLRV